MLEDSPVRLQTARLVLGLPSPSLAPVVARFYRDNREFFAPWDPPRPDSFTTDVFWEQRLEHNRRALLEDRELRLFAFDAASSEPRVVNAIGFTNLARGPLQACNLGYAQDRAACGRGLMHEALEAAIGHVFAALELHRIEAGYVPTNEASGRVLRKLGFVVEGYSRDYLWIGGQWRDHVRCALVNPDPEAARRP